MPTSQGMRAPAQKRTVPPGLTSWPLAWFLVAPNSDIRCPNFGALRKHREINADASAFSVPLRSDIKSSNYAAPHLYFQPLSTPLPRAERCQDQLVCCILGIKPYKISMAKKLSYLQRELNNLSKVLSLAVQVLQPKSSVLLVLSKICCIFVVLAIFLQKQVSLAHISLVPIFSELP